MRVSTISNSSTPLGDCVEPVLRSFNTWAFKRQQPSSIDGLRRCIAGAMARCEAIPFVLYWGKGPRRNLAAPDAQCLNYLATMAKAITQSYAPGARLTLICTDTHALHNGHAKSSTSCPAMATTNE